MVHYNRKIFVGLCIIAIIVWVYNGVQLFSNYTGRKRIADTESVSKVKLIEPFEYKNNFKDPFYCSYFMSEVIKKKVKSSKKTPKKTIKSIVKLPSYKISGIVYSAKNPMVMLEYNGKNVIAKEGDVIDLMHIKKIFPDSVSVVYKGKNFHLKK